MSERKGPGRQEVSWRMAAWCCHCKQRQSLIQGPNETMNDLGARAARSHEHGSPECFKRNGNSGMSVNIAAYENIA
jgi:hypothetical protein